MMRQSSGHLSGGGGGGGGTVTGHEGDDDRHRHRSREHHRHHHHHRSERETEESDAHRHSRRERSSSRNRRSREESAAAADRSLKQRSEKTRQSRHHDAAPPAAAPARDVHTEETPSIEDASVERKEREFGREREEVNVSSSPELRNSQPRVRSAPPKSTQSAPFTLYTGPSNSLQQGSVASSSTARDRKLAMPASDAPQGLRDATHEVFARESGAPEWDSAHDGERALYDEDDDIRIDNS